jgi:hypothetical protein
MSLLNRFFLVSSLLLAPALSVAGVIVGHKGPPLEGNLQKLNPISVQKTDLEPELGQTVQVLRSIPFALAEELAASSDVYEELLISDETAKTLSLFNHSLLNERVQIAGSELRTIVEQGPAANRICLTFLGDGYTEAQKDRFFEDVARLTQDIFGESTFASYLPLFNVYAVFTPSRDSGITDGSNRKQTAFGLYRSPAGSKRAIMPGNTGALETAIRLAPKTDYPIVIANDDYYGGLGGRYAITTRSIESGKIVLRHELGHNFGNVGEEYDGGQVYSGANSSRSSTNPSWSHWVDGNSRAYEMKMLDGQYLWQNLSTGPVRSRLNFPAPNAKGAYWFDVNISSVGWESPQDVVILLDGQKVDVEGRYTSDRSFFKVVLNRSLMPGEHTLEIRDGGVDSNNVLAFANLYAYEGDYEFNGKYGAFMTYDTNGRMSYRPTHEQCLMRDMTTPHFCAVDQENMWIRFLDRSTLIDSLEIVKDPAGSSRSVVLSTPDLKGLEIRWSLRASPTSAERELVEFRDQKQFVLSPDLNPNELVARVRFVTPEVRKPSAKFSAERTVRI